MSFLARPVDVPTTSGPHLQTITPIDNQPLITCCRHLAHRNEARRATPGSDPLEQDLTAVGLEFDRVLADPATADALHAADLPWPVLAPQLLKLLLTAADSALATDPSLTGLIADTVLLIQRDCREAWRLRALAHEQWGDLNSAVKAHEEYLFQTDLQTDAQTDVDDLGIGDRVIRLRRVRDDRAALAAALIDAHDSGATLPMPGAADLHDLLSRPVRHERLDPALEEFLTELTRLPSPDLTVVHDVQEAVVRLTTSARLAIEHGG